ncbi:MAG: 4-hydroxythreonine-4-phosphate dehydrogenase PdxA [Spirochaetaceae bacterium]|nr:MAG: 4-hydroxythreonine-4-phosphate dehydrogenase PdxA [Spirochaetaceae bacterium]
MIAITMGDANGIGPEIALTAFLKKELPTGAFVVGDASVLELCLKRLNLDINLNRIGKPEECREDALNVLDLKLLSPEQIAPGTISKDTGAAAAEYVATATRMALRGECTSLTTLPINKEATQLSIPGFSGHTEFIAEICGETNFTMMLASSRLIVTHVSTHVAIVEAARRVVRDRVHAVICLTNDALRGWIHEPRIAVAGLNPHAGEHGLFGTEDEREILPAIERARREGITVSGPEAPDTVFLGAVRGDYDAVVCMYHDQGHIPMKLLDFEQGVNVTLGLPIIRTSVDHGTAFDIAWQGRASSASLKAALDFAERMSGSAQETGSAQNANI